MNRQLTPIIGKEDDGYVALCPEVNVASQGDSVAEARDNLREALQPEVFPLKSHFKQKVTAASEKINEHAWGLVVHHEQPNPVEDQAY